MATMDSRCPYSDEYDRESIQSSFPKKKCDNCRYTSYDSDEGVFYCMLLSAPNWGEVK